MRKRMYLLLCSLFLLSLVSWAQNKSLKGKVVEDGGSKPLPDATINVVAGNFKKIIKTDASGNFSVLIPADATKIVLGVTYTGYAAQKVEADGKSFVTINLKPEAKDLGEDVVVIGYQTVKRKDVVASVASVGAKDLKDIPINSAAEALNGRLAGVTATTAEGSPDADVKVRVRGGTSITQDNSPLYIIDGVQVENGLNSVVLQDIQSIDVLKDAGATAIYGARGANGVIIITTKSGKPGKMKVSYNGFVGIKYLPKTLSVLSPYEYVLYEYERTRGTSDTTDFAKAFGSTYDTLSNYRNVSPVNWQKEVMGLTGISQTHNISLSGGNKKTTYNFSYTHNNDKAIVQNSSYKRHQFTLKLDHKVTNKIKVGLIGRYQNTNVYGSGVSDDKSASYSRLRNAVKYRPFLSTGQDLEDVDPLAVTGVGNGLSLVNPLLLTNSEYRRKTTNAYNITANLSYTINKNLSFKSTFGFDYNNLIDRQFSDSLSPFATIQGGRKPIVQLDSTTTYTITNSNVFTYSVKNIAKKHDIDLILGQEIYEVNTEFHSSSFKSYPNFIDPTKAFSQTDLGVVFSGFPKYVKEKATSLSFFSRLSYSYLKKYFFTFNMRADASSKFASNIRWGYFPSFSFAWKVKNEKFMKDINFISDLKLRTTFGTVGNNRIGNYLYLTTFNTNSYVYGINNVPITAYNSSGLVNEGLKWETTVNRNLGLDISLLKNRIDLSVDYYRNDVKDLLINVPVAATYGYATQVQNVGKTVGKGWEFQLNATILRNPKKLNWTTSFNMSFATNTVEALGKNQPQMNQISGWGSGTQVDYLVKPGQSVGAIYGYVVDGYYTTSDFDYNPTTRVYTLKNGVIANTPVGTTMPGTIKFRDVNGDGKIDDNDKTVIGNATPKFTGGWNNQFTYKNWDLSLFINFSYGNNILNANNLEFSNGYTPRSNLLNVMEGRYRTIDANGKLILSANSSGVVTGEAPAVLDAVNANANIWQPLKGTAAFYTHSWGVEDGSFIRINNLTIGYSFPIKSLVKLHISKLRIYATGNNLALFTKYSGYDPEVSVRKNPLTPGLDYSAYPKSRAFVFGVNVTF